MRAEVVTRNETGSFSGTCPHCNESIFSDARCGDEFQCSNCSERIGIQNHGSVFLFVRAPVKVLPRPRQPQVIDPDTYQEY